MQDALAEEFNWLNHVFGAAQNLTERRGTKLVKYPGVYASANQYISVLPSDTLGNISFFMLHDPIEVKPLSGRSSILTAKASIVFWANLNTVFGVSIDRNAERMTQDVLKFINGMRTKQGRFVASTMYRNSRHVYQGFDIEEADHQYLMQPYFGLRIEGKLIHRDIC
jgi:hypothetical protein